MPGLPAAFGQRLVFDWLLRRANCKVVDCRIAGLSLPGFEAAVGRWLAVCADRRACRASFRMTWRNWHEHRVFRVRVLDRPLDDRPLDDRLLDDRLLDDHLLDDHPLQDRPLPCRIQKKEAVRSRVNSGRIQAYFRLRPNRHLLSAFAEKVCFDLFLESAIRSVQVDRL